jgi:hypothetical protein
MGLNTNEESNKDHRSFAIVMRGRPDDFLLLCKQAKASGLFVVYTRTSHMKLEVREVPF